MFFNDESERCKMTLGNSNVWESLTTVTSFDTGTPPEETMSETMETIENNNAVSQPPSVATPISLLIQSLVQQLCMLLEKDRQRAVNLYNTICKKLHQMQLLDETYTKGEFEEMRYQYQVALGQLMKVANEADSSRPYRSTWSISSTTEPAWSRYYKEFEETEFIAKGGFGEVYKAKNRLDGVEYAIKKVVLPMKDINCTVSKHFDEVKTFASLNHPNIVPYKSAWLEPKVNFKTTADIENGVEGKFYSSTADFTDDSYLSKKSDNFEVVFQESNHSANSKMHESVRSVTYSKESVEECKALVKLQTNNYVDHFNSGYIDFQYATLYIQMSLCEMTLKAWIENRNSQTSNGTAFSLDSPHVCNVINIFSQLAEGVNYIHNLKIVHHDIKPTNIFIGEILGDFHIQLADFGLACPLQESYHVPASGTCVYAAPEQIQGQCHVKNDLFSIGLILLELIESFGTNMEKIKIFRLLREGSMPDHIEENCPELAGLISSLAEIDLHKRIDSNELLLRLKTLRENKDDTIRNLQNEVIVKDEIIESQREQIMKLRLLLEKNNIKT